MSLEMKFIKKKINKYAVVTSFALKDDEKIKVEYSKDFYDKKEAVDRMKIINQNFKTRNDLLMFNVRLEKTVEERALNYLDFINYSKVIE